MERERGGREREGVEKERGERQRGRREREGGREMKENRPQHVNVNEIRIGDQRFPWR